ncbi:MAG: hypothetical protein K6C08_09185 [Oscillospiraceae bacterium]|nr:hypothetical protein [Oscillospiraceae bacterium]
MTKSKLLLIVQSVLCILLVVVLASSAIGIYRAGTAEKLDDPLAWIYTREKVAAALKSVLPFLFASVGVTIACAALKVRDEDQDKPVKDIELNRNLMRSRVSQPSEDMQREQAVQKKLLYGGWTGFALCMLPVLIYMTDGSHFTNGDLEEMIRSLAAHVFPWSILGLACLILSAIWQEKSIRREYDAIMLRIREEKASGVKAEPEQKTQQKNLVLLRTALLILAVVFIIAGVRNGSMNAVMNKAIRICTECVGLG